MRRPTAAISLVLACLVSGALLTSAPPASAAATATLLKNVNPSGNASPAGSGGAGEFRLTTMLGDTFYFAAFDGTTQGLWKSDGTTANTTQISLPNDARNPDDLTVAGGKLFFTARTDATGREVYVYDPATNTASAVGEVYLGSNDGVVEHSSAFPKLTAVGDRVYFNGRNPAPETELYSTSGSAPTEHDLNPGGSSFTARIADMGSGNLFFIASVDNGLTPKPWKGDGTTFSEITTPSGLTWGEESIVRMGANAFTPLKDATDDEEIWKWDGTSLTKLFDVTATGSDPGKLHSSGTQLAWRARDATEGYRIYVSDGTTAGSHAIGDHRPDCTDISCGQEIKLLGWAGERVIYVAFDGTTQNLYSSDGVDLTAAHTTILNTTFQVQNGSNEQAADLGSTLMFVGDDQDGTGGFEPWVTDGTIGGTSGTNINPGLYTSSSPHYLTGANEVGYLFANDGTDGDEPRKITTTPTTSYELTVNRTGPGTVESSPSGIDCGSDCSESYAENTQVTLTAEPGSGATFQGWGGACSGTGGCQVTMSQARTVTATFASSGPSVSLAINDVTLREGRKGTTRIFAFTVTATGAFSSPITFDWATADGTARQPGDYLPGSGSATIGVGETTEVINVTVRGDRRRERSETFTVNLSNVVGATVADGTGLGKIRNDDR